MGVVEEKLRQKLSEDDYELALQILKLPPSRIRLFIEEKAEEVSR